MKTASPGASASVVVGRSRSSTLGAIFALLAFAGCASNPDSEAPPATRQAQRATERNALARHHPELLWGPPRNANRQNGDSYEK